MSRVHGPWTNLGGEKIRSLYGIIGNWWFEWIGSFLNVMKFSQ
jgi:hypothetical protein